FDVSRGNRFSTYASWAVMRWFSSLMVESSHQRERYQTGHEEIWVSTNDPQADDPTEIPAEAATRAVVREILETLEPRERDVVARRFGLSCEHSQTLAQVSRHLRVSRERVRQIELKGLRKLRDALTERGLAAQFA